MDLVYSNIINFIFRDSLIKLFYQKITVILLLSVGFTEVHVGLDNLELSTFSGKDIAVVVNHTSINKEGNHQ